MGHGLNLCSLVQPVQLMVRRAGVNIQKIVSGLQNMNIHLDQYLSIVHPEVTFTISSIRKFINSHFVLQTRRDMMPEAWRDRPMLELRGGINELIDELMNERMNERMK